MRGFIVASWLVASLRLTEEATALLGNPGVGLDPTDHGFANVYKDGYMHVGCMMDYMEAHGDMHGENRHAYAKASSAVSIVRYADRVPANKVQRMTPRVCYEFCRSIDGMSFFGLHDGRGCYCTPFYERRDGSGNVCDLPCEGEPTVKCGGKILSNVYAMHSCNDLLERMKEDAAAAWKVQKDAAQMGDYALWAASTLERAADKLMIVATEGGDMISNAYGQRANEHAATLRHAGEASSAAAKALAKQIGAVKALRSGKSGRDLEGRDAEVVAMADSLLDDLRARVAAAKAAAREAEPLNLAVFPDVPEASAKGGANLFEPIMASVNRWTKVEGNVTAARGAQTTCGGTPSAEPVIGLSVGECAEACNRLAPESAHNFCVGFSHYSFTGMETVPKQARGWYGPLRRSEAYKARRAFLEGEPDAGGLNVEAFPYYYTPSVDACPWLHTTEDRLQVGCADGSTCSLVGEGPGHGVNCCGNDNLRHCPLEYDACNDAMEGTSPADGETYSCWPAGTCSQHGGEKPCVVHDTFEQPHAHLSENAGAYYENQAAATFPEDQFYYYTPGAGNMYYHSTEFDTDGGGEIYVYPLCFLFRDLEEVVDYKCDFGAEWKQCADSPPDWHAEGQSNVDCEWHAYSRENCPREWYTGYDGRFAHEACCACGGGEMSGSESVDPMHAAEPAEGFLQLKPARTSREPGGHDLPLPLVQNKCMARFSWAYKGHLEPERQTLDRCFGQQIAGTEVDAVGIA